MTPEEKARFFKTARSRIELRAGRTDWYRISDVATAEHTGTTSATVNIFDEIGWFGVTAEEFVAEIDALDVDELTVRINSPGGSVFDGVTIFNRIKDHRATVHVIIDGLAASAAAFIAQAGDTIAIKPDAMMMIHDASGLVIGQAQDMRDMADLLDKVSGNIAALFARETGVGTTEAWRAMMAPDDTWFTAAEAVEAGLAHEIDGEPAESDPENSWDLSIYSYSNRADAPAPDLAALIASLDPEPPVPPADPEPEPEAAVVFDREAFLTAMNNSTREREPARG